MHTVTAYSFGPTGIQNEEHLSGERIVVTWHPDGKLVCRIFDREERCVAVEAIAGVYRYKWSRTT